jgi:hypothetical protein
MIVFLEVIVHDLSINNAGILIVLYILWTK